MDEKKPRRKKRNTMELLKHKTFRIRNVFSVIALILTIILAFSLGKLKIVSTGLVIESIILLVILNVIGVICINVHRKPVVKAMGWLIIGIDLCLSIVMLFYSRTTNTFLKDSFDSNKHLYTESTYYLIGLNAPEVAEVNLSGNYGIYDKTYNLNGAADKLAKKHTLTQIQYGDISEVFNGLVNYSINYALIDKIAYENYFAVQSILTKEQFKLIDEFDVYSKNTRPINEERDSFNILVRLNNSSGNSNNNLILSVNLKTRKVLMSYIPLNIYMNIAEEEKYEKLAYINAYGTSTAIKSIENLLGIDISYSVNIDEKQLIEYIDYIGDVEYCTEQTISVSDIFKLEEGCQDLVSSEVTQLLAFEDKNLKNDIIENIVKKISENTLENVTPDKYRETLNAFGKVYESNIPNDLIKQILKDVINNEDKWSIDKQFLNGDIAEMPVVSIYTYQTVEIANQDQINTIKSKIDEVLS